jgi:hypothetical protein
MVVTPPTLAQLALVGIVPILALVPFCGGSSLLLLQAAKTSTRLASSHFAVVIILTSEPATTLLCIPFILQIACALALLLGPSVGLAPSGPLQAAFKSACADLSLTPGTILSKLLGLKPQRGSPCGPAQALFKSVKDRFVNAPPPSCNSNYFGYKIAIAIKKPIFYASLFNLA